MKPASWGSGPSAGRGREGRASWREGRRLVNRGRRGSGPASREAGTADHDISIPPPLLLPLPQFTSQPASLSSISSEARPLFSSPPGLQGQMLLSVGQRPKMPHASILSRRETPDPGQQTF